MTTRFGRQDGVAGKRSGGVCDLDVTGAPSIFKRIRSTAVLTRMLPILDLISIQSGDSVRCPRPVREIIRSTYLEEVERFAWLVAGEDGFVKRKLGGVRTEYVCSVGWLVGWLRVCGVRHPGSQLSPSVIIVI